MKTQTKSLLKDQRGLVFAYITVLGVVVGIGVCWIIFNEVVIHIGDVVETLGTSQGIDIWHLIVFLWRILPVVLILGAFLWAILLATREEPYRRY